MSAFAPRRGWGPEGKRAALCITFDNLGEAGDIEIGRWGDAPVGDHTTGKFIPALLEALGTAGATYFIEACNVELYPHAIALWHEAGGEVGLHAWRHEIWARCGAEQRRDILARCMAAMRALGITPEGFRPPGGKMPPEIWPEIWGEFAAAGLRYCSDVSTDGIVAHGTVLSVPFTWPLVDALYFEDLAKPLRLSLGMQEMAFTPDRWASILHDAFDAMLRNATQMTVIFHPNLLATDPDKLAILREFAGRARQDADVWVARAGEVARFAAAELGLG